jgi:hypothetical protein
LIKAYGIALAGFLLARLGPAFAKLGPQERLCIVGEQRVNVRAEPYRKALARDQEIKGVPAIEGTPAEVVAADSGPFLSEQAGR